MQRYAFDKIWFEEHQKGLIWLLNAPIIKYWFRWVLRIHKDCSFKEKICEIQPNSYKVYLGLFLTKKGLRHKFRLDFRTHNKFSKRLYHAFYPLWLAFHIWDLFADKFTPQLSFGFSTLTVYPDADVESTSVDGTVTRSGVNESWASIRGGAGTAAAPSIDGSHIFLISCSASANQFDFLRRSICLFDTSALGAGTSISNAVISIFGYAKTDDNSFAPNTNIFGSTPASNTDLVSSDFSQTQDVAFATAITYANWSTVAYNDFTLNATGLAAIAKTGISKFSVKNDNYDAANSAPVWSSGMGMAVNGWFADAIGTSTDPKLVITYTITTQDLILLCAQGSFTLTGVATTFVKALKMAMAYATFTLTGIASALRKGKILICNYGSFTLTGIATLLTSTRKMLMSYGSFALTGIIATFNRALKMTMSVGIFSLIGQVINFRSRTMYGKEAKPTTNYIKEEKPTTSFTKNSKPTTSYTKEEKLTTSFLKENKPTTLFTKETKL